MKYKKLESTSVRGICVVCNKNPQKKVSGKNKYRSICSSCDKNLYSKESSSLKRLKRFQRDNRKTRIKRGGYRSHKKDYCEKCGFSSKYEVQFDVDHIDGNHNNNEITNLQTLCSNCHRLKTFLCEEGIHKKKGPLD